MFKKNIHVRNLFSNSVKKFKTSTPAPAASTVSHSAGAAGTVSRSAPPEGSENASGADQHNSSVSNTNTNGHESGGDSGVHEHESITVRAKRSNPNLDDLFLKFFLPRPLVGLGVHPVATGRLICPLPGVDEHTYVVCMDDMRLSPVVEVCAKVFVNLGSSEADKGRTVGGVVVCVNSNGTLGVLFDNNEFSPQVRQSEVVLCMSRTKIMVEKEYEDMLLWMRDAGVRRHGDRERLCSVLYYRGWREWDLFLLKDADIHCMTYLKRSVRMLVLEKAEWQRTHDVEMRALEREKFKEQRSWRYFIQKYSGFISANFAGLGVFSVFLWNFRNYRKHQRSFQVKQAVQTLISSVEESERLLQVEKKKDFFNLRDWIPSLSSEGKKDDSDKSLLHTAWESIRFVVYSLLGRSEELMMDEEERHAAEMQAAAQRDRLATIGALNITHQHDSGGGLPVDIEKMPTRDGKRHHHHKRRKEEPAEEVPAGSYAEIAFPGQQNHPPTSSASSYTAPANMYSFGDINRNTGPGFLLVNREEEESWLRRLIRKMDINHPRVTVITGYHGCGKSTLFRTAVEKEKNPALFVEIRGKDSTLTAILRSLKVPNIDVCGDPTEFIAEVLRRTTKIVGKPPILVLSLRQGSDLQKAYTETVGLTCDRMLCHLVLEVALENISLQHLNIPRMDFYKVPNFTISQAYEYSENLLDPVGFNHFLEVMGTNSDEIDELYAAVAHRKITVANFTNAKLCKAIRVIKEVWEDSDADLRCSLCLLASTDFETGQHLGVNQSALHTLKRRGIVLYDPVQHRWLFTHKVFHTAARTLASPVVQGIPTEEVKATLATA